MNALHARCQEPDPAPFGGLRIDDGVPMAELAALDLAPERIEALVELGLLARDPDRLRATRAGRLVLDRLTVELLVS